MLSELEAGLGYTFRDKSILENALTHSSYANENRERGLRDNERLEFLGDSILGFVVADYLYRSFPDRPEGELTRIRADLVCEKNLARAAGTISLGSFLLLGHGEEHGGGRKRDSIVSDAMESVIAMSRPESRIILTTRPPCRSWCSARRIRSCATSSSASPAPITTRNLMSKSCSTASPAARAPAAAKNAPSRPLPRPPSTRCSRENCKKRNKTGCLPAARSFMR